MTRRDMRRSSFRIALSGLLVALMLVLGYVESMIPLNAGVPGIKLGLSNGVLIFAVYMLDIPTAYSLMALKVLLSGLLFAGPSAMAYAFAGGLLSLTCMCLLSRVRGVRPFVVSIVGGVMHNVGQVGLAMIILHTANLAYYLAVLTVVGAACGLLTGVCAEAVMKHLRHTGLGTQRMTRKNGALTILVAVLLILGVGFMGWKTLHKVSSPNVTVEFSDPGLELPVPPGR